MITDIALSVASIWLGSLFVYSGSLKLLASPEHGVRILQGYKFLPAGASIVARVLPYAEVAAGGLILITPFARVGAYVALVLGMFFAVASGSVLARGIKASCGCAGDSSGRVTAAGVARAMLITFAASAVATAGNPLGAPIGWIVFGAALAPVAAISLRRSVQRYSGATEAGSLPGSHVIRPEATGPGTGT